MSALGSAGPWRRDRWRDGRLNSGRRRHRLADPDKDLAVLVDSEVLHIDQLCLQVFEERVVEIELASERAVGDTPTAPQKLNDRVEPLIKRHAQ
jgi:hypothetical protein